MAQMVKRPPTVRETWVQSLGWEDLLEKEMATHSSILAWKIPWTEKPGVYSPWGRKESDTTEQLHFHFRLTIIPKCSSFLPGAFHLSLKNFFQPIFGSLLDEFSQFFFTRGYVIYLSILKDMLIGYRILT